MTTLSNLMDEYGGNGYIRIDSGNGAAGPSWIEWNSGIEAICGDIEMQEQNDEATAYGEEDDEKETTLLQIVRYVIPDYASDTIFASEWVEDDNRNYPYRADNPYRYRIIF